jgi:hypothetical protein
VTGVCQPALARTRLEVGLVRCQRVHFASYAAAMAWISASWQYNLFAPSAEGGSSTFRGVAAAASVWLPLQLAKGAAPLA